MENEYNISRREWGRRVNQMAKSAETSYSMATVVGNITDTDEALKVLRKIKYLVDSKEFFNYIVPFKKFRKFQINKTKKWLIWKLSKLNISDTVICQLNWNSKFFYYLSIIIKNKM